MNNQIFIHSKFIRINDFEDLLKKAFNKINKTSIMFKNLLINCLFDIK